MVSKKIIYNVKFTKFIDAPLSAKEEIKRFNSLNSFEVFNYDYYLVSNYNTETNKLEYYLLIPLTNMKIKSIADRIIEEWNSDIVEFDNMKILIVRLEDDNNLLNLMKKVENTVKNYVNVNNASKIRIKIVGDKLVVDQNDGGILVEMKEVDDPTVAKIFEFVTLYDYFSMGKVMFKITDFLIVSLDGLTIITRFKSIPKVISLPQKGMILYIVAPEVNNLRTGVVSHRIRIYLEELRKMNEELFEKLKSSVIRYAELYGLDKQRLLDELDNDMFNISAEVNFSGDTFGMRLLYYDGEYQVEGIIPEHIMRHILLTYYTKLSKKYVKLLKKMKEEEKYAEPSLDVPNVSEFVEEVDVKEEKTSEEMGEKKSFFGLLFGSKEKKTEKKPKKKVKKKAKKVERVVEEKPSNTEEVEETQLIPSIDLKDKHENFDEIDEEITIELV